MKPVEPPRLERLQSYLDGELKPPQREDIEQLLDDDAVARAELRVLRSVRDGLNELAEALPPAAPSPGWSVVRSRVATIALLAAAAAVVVTVGILANREQDSEPSFAENESFSLRCLPRNGGHGPIFSDLGLGLEIRAEGGREAMVVPWADGRTEEELAVNVAAAFAADASTARSGDAVLPLVVEVEVEDPDGQLWLGRARPAKSAATADGSGLRLDLSLWDLFVVDAGPPPLWSVQPHSNGWIADYEWTYRQFQPDSESPRRRFVPRSPGVHRLKVTVRGLAGGAATWTVAEPLSIQTSVVVDGVATDWSEPVEGLRARLVVPTTTVRAGAVVPLALQLENVSDGARTYSIAGHTRAPIPQPYFVDCLVDAVEVQQPGTVPVVVIEAINFHDHAPGTIRTMVLNSEVWRQADGEPILAKPGRHRVQLGLHTRMLIVVGNDPARWQGKVRAPELTFTVRD